jgi:hypothetical protein
MANSSMKVPAVVASAIIGLVVGAGAMLLSLKGLGYMDAPRIEGEAPEFVTKGKGKGKGGAPKGGPPGGKGAKDKGKGEADPNGGNGKTEGKKEALPGGDKGS